MTKLRLSSHELMIERGRWLKMSLCTYCHTIEVCVCPQNMAIRKQYIKPYYGKKPFKFTQLLNTDNLSEMQKLVIFLKRLFAIYSDQIHVYN